MILESYNYEFYGQGVEESVDHLFLHCPFCTIMLGNDKLDSL